MSFHTYFGTKHRWFVPGHEPFVWRVGIPDDKLYCLKCGINKADYELKMAIKRDQEWARRKQDWSKKEARLRKKWIYPGPE